MIELFQQLLTTPAGQLFTVTVLIFIGGNVYQTYRTAKTNSTIAEGVMVQNNNMIRLMEATQDRQDKFQDRFIEAIQEVSRGFSMHNSEALLWRNQAGTRLDQISGSAAELAVNSAMANSIIGDMSRTDRELHDRMNRDVIPGLLDIKTTLGTMGADIAGLNADFKSGRLSSVYQKLGELDRSVRHIARVIDMKITDEIPIVQINTVETVTFDPMPGRVADSDSNNSGDGGTDGL